jgi:hypothetical protein
VVNDLQHLNEAERGPQPAQGRLLIGVDLRHATDQLPPRLVAPCPEVQVYAAALPLDLVDLSLAVLLAAGLEREQLGVPR